MTANSDTESQFEARAGICLARSLGSWWDIAPSSHGHSGVLLRYRGRLSDERRVESMCSRARVIVKIPASGIYSDEEMPPSGYCSGEDMSIVSALAFAMRCRVSLDIAQRPFQSCGYCSRAGCPIGYFGDPRPDHTRKVPGR